MYYMNIDSVDFDRCDILLHQGFCHGGESLLHVAAVYHTSNHQTPVHGQTIFSREEQGHAYNTFWETGISPNNLKIQVPKKEAGVTWGSLAAAQDRAK